MGRRPTPAFPKGDAGCSNPSREKIGPLHEETNYPPFKSYGVEGWWLDNLLKQGKLTRENPDFVSRLD